MIQSHVLYQLSYAPSTFVHQVYFDAIQNFVSILGVIYISQSHVNALYYSNNRPTTFQSIVTKTRPVNDTVVVFQVFEDQIQGNTSNAAIELKNTAQYQLSIRSLSDYLEIPFTFLLAAPKLVPPLRTIFLSSNEFQLHFPSNYGH